LPAKKCERRGKGGGKGKTILNNNGEEPVSNGRKPVKSGVRQLSDMREVDDRERRKINAEKRPRSITTRKRGGDKELANDAGLSG